MKTNKASIEKIIKKLKGIDTSSRGARGAYKRKDVVESKPAPKLYRERDMRDEAKSMGSHGHEYFGGSNEQVKR